MWLSVIRIPSRVRLLHSAYLVLNLNLLWSPFVLFFCVKDLLLNVVSNSTPIYRDKYSFLPKEVLKILNNINIAKCPGVGGPSCEILPKIFPQLYIGVVSTSVEHNIV